MHRTRSSPEERGERIDFQVDQEGRVENVTQNTA